MITSIRKLMHNMGGLFDEIFFDACGASRKYFEEHALSQARENFEFGSYIRMNHRLTLDKFIRRVRANRNDMACGFQFHTWGASRCERERSTNRIDTQFQRRER